MNLSKTELNLLLQISMGKTKVLEVALALNKDISQIYHILKILEKKGFAKLDKGLIKPFENTHVNLLLQEISRRPNIINHLADSGITIFTAILEPKSAIDITKETVINKSMVFLKLKEAKKNSFINIIEKKYVFNKKIWPKVYEFLTELKKYEETVDNRIPKGAVIYYKNENEIIFSTKLEFDAVLTGFSAYEQFGIKLLTIDNTYYLPKKILTKQEVFSHSLYRAEKEGDSRDFIFIALFYIKYKNELSKITHEIIENINKVLNGQIVKYYPTLKEIKDRADVYDIKL